MTNDQMTVSEAGAELKRTAPMIYKYFSQGKLTKVKRMVNGEERTFINRSQVEALKNEMYPTKG